MQVSEDLTSISQGTQDRDRRQAALRLHRTLVTFVRRYQFRNRNEVCCYGVSVSQCYVLEALGEKGPLSMQELGAELGLDVSTVTRVVDGLVRKRLLRRTRDDKDRRVVRAELTPAGVKLHLRIRDDLLAREEALLLSIPENLRQDVVAAMGLLLRGLMREGGSCCGE